MNSPHKGPVTPKMFPFDDVIMEWSNPLYSPWRYVAAELRSTCVFTALCESAKMIFLKIVMVLLLRASWKNDTFYNCNRNWRTIRLISDADYLGESYHFTVLSEMAQIYMESVCFHFPWDPGVPFVNIAAKDIFNFTKCLLSSLNHVHVWRVSPQLSGADTCRIWTWYSMANHYLDNNGGNLFSTPTPDLPVAQY